MKTKPRVTPLTHTGLHVDCSSKLLILNLSRPKLSTTSPEAWNSPLPSDRYLNWLVWALRGFGYKITTLSEALADPTGARAVLTFDSSDQSLYTRVFPALSRREVPATVFVPVTEISEDPGQSNHLTWAHLQHLQRCQWEIGTQGLAVADLSSLGFAGQRHHVAETRSALAKRLGQEPRVFAYPMGAYDANTVACVRDEGYAAAVTLKRGLNGEGTDAFHLRRLALGLGWTRDLSMIARTAVATPANGSPRQLVRPASTDIEALPRGALS